jgi:hypothetical protein
MNYKRLIRNTTPFIILSIVAVLAFFYFIIIERKAFEGTGYLIVAFPMVAIGVMLAVDFSLKRVLKSKLGWIWVIEIILSLASTYWWIIS